MAANNRCDEPQQCAGIQNLPETGAAQFEGMIQILFGIAEAQRVLQFVLREKGFGALGFVHVNKGQFGSVCFDFAAHGSGVCGGFAAECSAEMPQENDQQRIEIGMLF